MYKRVLLLYIIIAFSLTHAQSIKEEKLLSLKDVIEIALNNNPDIIRAKQNIIAEEGRFLRGISLAPPVLSFNYDEIPIKTGLRNFKERTIEINQSFDFPTKIILSSNKLNKNITLAKEQLSMTELSITSTVTKAYMKVLAQKAKIKLYGENLLIAKNFYEKAEIKKNAGEATHLELLTSKVQLAQAKNQLEIAYSYLNSVNAELFYLAGLNNNDYQKYKIKDSLFCYNLKNEITLEFIENAALDRSPKKKIAELNFTISDLSNSLAWSGLLPTFSVGYNRKFIDGNPNFYGVSLGISLPVWFMWGNRGEIMESYAGLSIAKADLQDTYNRILLDTKTAFTEFLNADRQLKLYKGEIIPQSEEIYRSAQISYDSGESTYLEYLQARQILVSAKSEFLEVLVNYNTSILNLEELAGQSLTKSE